ncbi:MAG: ABC transporter permease [Bulleidia sp.]|nr:ABC transporter permease [Bulleidia sp.]
MNLIQVSSLSVATLFRSFPAGVAQGIIWGIMAVGVYITFRLLDVADLTVDGTFTTGGAVTVMLIIAGWNPWAAMLIAFIAGLCAGAVTGLLHTKFGIPVILSGILTQFALYSINLAIMGMSANKAINVDRYALAVTSRNIPATIIIAGILAIVLIAVLYWYFGTENGSAMRATGCNSEMAKAQGINISTMQVSGLALSNGLVALSGGLMSQYQGFADINMGRGSIVIGLAAVIIGEVLARALLSRHMNFFLTLLFTVIGGIIYYLVMDLVLWFNINSNYLKLFTSLIVAVFLTVPYLQDKARSSFSKAGKRSKMRSRKAGL